MSRHTAEQLVHKAIKDYLSNRDALPGLVATTQQLIDTGSPRSEVAVAIVIGDPSSFKRLTAEAIVNTKSLVRQFEVDATNEDARVRLRDSSGDPDTVVRHPDGYTFAIYLGHLGTGTVELCNDAQPAGGGRFASNEPPAADEPVMWETAVDFPEGAYLGRANGDTMSITVGGVDGTEFTTTFGMVYGSDGKSLMVGCSLDPVTLMPVDPALAWLVRESDVADEAVRAAIENLELVMDPAAVPFEATVAAQAEQPPMPFSTAPTVVEAADTPHGGEGFEERSENELPGDDLTRSQTDVAEEPGDIEEVFSVTPTLTSDGAEAIVVTDITEFHRVAEAVNVAGYKTQ